MGTVTLYQRYIKQSSLARVTRYKRSDVQFEAPRYRRTRKKTQFLRNVFSSPCTLTRQFFFYFPTAQCSQLVSVPRTTYFPVVILSFHMVWHFSPPDMIILGFCSVRMKWTIPRHMQLKLQNYRNTFLEK
jgi:hypothetical protein